MSESLLLSENFDVCRLCLTERDTDGYEPFVHIMTPIDGKLKSKKRVLDLLGINVESDDDKPKMICKCCFGALDNFHKLKKKANESQIVVDYIAKKKFGGTVPETSVASTSSLMLSSHETPFKSNRSNEFGDSMPGTSTASTSSLMLSSHETSFKGKRSLSKRSNEFGDSMPGTSKASTSRGMVRKKVESSHETPFKSNRLISKRSNELGDSMPGTSTPSTSSMMLRKNRISSQEPPLKHSRLPSKQSNEFGDSMPGTSKASTSREMVRKKEESSHETPFKSNRSISKRSNEVGDSMPGTSNASTSREMVRTKEESSHETPFKSNRSISKRSNESGDSMPGTSNASTSREMVRTKEEPSHETPFKSNRSISKRSNESGDSIPGTSNASTSREMVRKKEESSHETPFKSNRSISKRSNDFGDSMPGTSKASTSGEMVRKKEESSHETPFKSNRSNEFGDSMPGTSTPSTSSMMLRKNKISSQEPPFKHSRSPSKQSNKIGNSMPGTSTSELQSWSDDEHILEETSTNHSQSITKKQPTKYGAILNPHISNDSFTSPSLLATYDVKTELDDESDDGSCIITSAPIETVVLISDDEDYGNGIIENVDLSDYEETLELSQDESIIELSSDSEDSENNLKQENVNTVTEPIYYCSICQKKNILDHDCSQHTKSFFTCLVPGCNVLSRSKKDFTYHYQPHIGMSTSGVMCHRCFKGIDQSDIDGNGCHINCDVENAFKCYLCNVKFNSIQEFAYHKLKMHNGVLMDSRCHYLCLHCEESSNDKNVINDHMNNCLDFQEKNATAASMKPKKETELFPVKNVNVRKSTNGNNSMIPRTSDHVLFTCLKPSCQIIFQSFSNFKKHYRHHFELGDSLVCWQCCKPCSDKPALRAHQAKNNCRTPGMFKCYQCSLTFDDIESLSIHKLTFHESMLIAGKPNKKTIICAFCDKDIIISNFKSHLVQCRKKNGNTNTCTSKNKGDFTCLTCERVFASSISLSNHSRVHKKNQVSNLKQERT